jgi:hypothetical protein
MYHSISTIDKIHMKLQVLRQPKANPNQTLSAMHIKKNKFFFIHFFNKIKNENEFRYT